MCKYIDVSKIVEALPEDIEERLNPSNHNHHPEIKIELPNFSAVEGLIEYGETKLIQSCTILYNFPDSHYGEINGFTTNIGLHIFSGVFKRSFSWYFFVKVYNPSTKPNRLPYGMFIGSFLIKHSLVLLVYNL